MRLPWRRRRAGTPGAAAEPARTPAGDPEPDLHRAADEAMRALTDPGALGAAEWDSLVAVLARAGRWDDLWRLVEVAPPLHGVRILRALGSSGAPAVGQAERRLLDHAVRCGPEPPPGLVYREQPSTLVQGPGAGALHLSADGRLALTRANDGVLSLWRLPSGEPAGTLRGHGPKHSGTRAVTAVAPDAGRVASWGHDAFWSDGVVHLWDLPAGGDPVALEGAPKFVGSLVFTPDGALLAAEGWSYERRRTIHRVVIWRLPERRPLRSRRLRCLKQGHELAAVPDGSVLLASCGEAVHRFGLPGAERLPTISGPAGSLLWTSPDGERVMHRTTDTLRVRRLADGAVEAAVPVSVVGVAHPSFHRQDTVATPDGSIVHSTPGVLRWGPDRGDQGVTRVQRHGALTGWDTMAPLDSLASDPGEIRCLALAPDGRLLAGARLDDGVVHLWHARTGASVGSLAVPGERVTALWATPEALLGHVGATIRLWPALLPRVARTPLRAVAPADAQRLHTAPDAMLTADERAWTALVSGLVRWSHRHDVEIADVDVARTAAPASMDVELDDPTD